MLNHWNWKYTSIVIFALFGALAWGLVMASSFVVDGLRPPGGDCMVAIDIENPASHTECDKVIDALRWDALWGVLIVAVSAALLGALMVAASNNPNVKFWKIVPATALITLAVTFAVIPWIVDRADDAKLIEEVTWRSIAATILLIGIIVIGSTWNYVVDRHVRRWRRNRRRATTT